MLELEVKQHLKDCLFHGVHKHIRDSIRYLYSTPGASYSQLMVAACKAESENKEIQDEVRARAAVKADSGEGTTEWDSRLPNWWLPWPGQGRVVAQPVLQIAPERERGHGRGQTDRGTPGHTSTHNSQTSCGQTSPDCSTHTDCTTGTTISRNQGQNS